MYRREHIRGFGMRCIVALIFMCLFVPCVFGQVGLDEAFLAVREAEAAGADVGGLVDDLNHAIELYEAGDTDEAGVIVEGVIVRADMLQVRAERQGLTDGIVAVLVTGLFVGAAVVIWLKGDRWFWRLWGYTKRGFVVGRR